MTPYAAPYKEKTTPAPKVTRFSTDSVDDVEASETSLSPWTQVRYDFCHKIATLGYCTQIVHMFVIKFVDALVFPSEREFLWVTALSTIPIYWGASLAVGFFLHVAVEKPWYILLTHAETLVVGAVRRAVDVDAAFTRLSILCPSGVELKMKKDK